MGKAIIFDVDGTLLDTEKIYMQAWREAGALFGYTVTEEVLMNTRAVSKTIALKAFMDGLGEDFPYEDVRRERMRIGEAMIYAAEPAQLQKAGALEVLELLKGQGIPMAVASSTAYDQTVAHLDHAGLLGYFQVIVGGDMIRRGKPNPDIFLKVAELLGADPKDCVVVEDSPAGIKAAYAAGMKPVLIPDVVPANAETNALSAAVIEEISQLPRAIEI